jgi:hypothetical protein
MRVLLPARISLLLALYLAPASARPAPLLERFDLVLQGATVQLSWAIHFDAAPQPVRLAARCNDFEWGVKFLRSASGEYLARDTPTTVAQGRIEYQLFVRSASGAWSLLAQRDIDLAPQPPMPQLRAPAPNPFSPRTTIAFWLPSEQLVSLSIFDAAGRQVRKLLSSVSLPSGEHSVGFDGRDAHGQRLASGSYLCQLTTDAGMRTRRLTLVK